MRISPRVIIEASAAIIAVGAYGQLASKYRKLREDNARVGRLLIYTAEILDREKVSMDQFDKIAINTIIMPIIHREKKGPGWHCLEKLSSLPRFAAGDAVQKDLLLKGTLSTAGMRPLNPAFSEAGYEASSTQLAISPPKEDRARLRRVSYLALRTAATTKKSSYDHLEMDAMLVLLPKSGSVSRVARRRHGERTEQRQTSAAPGPV